jgi:hypothetical protein
MEIQELATLPGDVLHIILFDEGVMQVNLGRVNKYYNKLWNSVVEKCNQWPSVISQGMTEMIYICEHKSNGNTLLTCSVISAFGWVGASISFNCSQQIIVSANDECPYKRVSFNRDTYQHRPVKECRFDDIYNDVIKTIDQCPHSDTCSCDKNNIIVHEEQTIVNNYVQIKGPIRPSLDTYLKFVRNWYRKWLRPDFYDFIKCSNFDYLR